MSRPVIRKSCKYCGRPHYGLGYCRMHWERLRRTGRLGPKKMVHKAYRLGRAARRSIARKLREGRAKKKRGTARELAVRYGCTEQHIYKIERQEREGEEKRKK